MPVMFELTDLNVSTLYTGSVYTLATTVAATQITPEATINTGSWQGLASTYGVDEAAAQSLSSSAGGVINMGTWGGVDYSYGVSSPASESYDRDTVIQDGNPSTNQSIAAGDWDPFPTPEENIEVPDLPQRDITRYRKGYSSQRLQVQRISYTRRRT